MPRPVTPWLPDRPFGPSGMTERRREPQSARPSVADPRRVAQPAGAGRHRGRGHRCRRGPGLCGPPDQRLGPDRILQGHQHSQRRRRPAGPVCRPGRVRRGPLSEAGPRPRRRGRQPGDQADRRRPRRGTAADPHRPRYLPRRRRDAQPAGQTLRGGGGRLRRGRGGVQREQRLRLPGPDGGPQAGRRDHHRRRRPNRGADRRRTFAGRRRRPPHRGHGYRRRPMALRPDRQAPARRPQAETGRRPRRHPRGSGETSPGRGRGGHPGKPGAAQRQPVPRLPGQPQHAGPDGPADRRLPGLLRPVPVGRPPSLPVRPAAGAGRQSPGPPDPGPGRRRHRRGCRLRPGTGSGSVAGRHGAASARRRPGQRLLPGRPPDPDLRPDRSGRLLRPRPRLRAGRQLDAGP